MRTRKSRVALIAALSAVAIASAACGDDDDTTTDATTTTTGAMTTTMMMTTTAEGQAAAAAPVGPGCAAYAEQVPSGPGSLESMATQPVTAAAADSPLLNTLTAAVSGQLNPQVNLAATLDGGEFTIFAPVDSAFEALDPATLESLKTDSAALTAILTYHAVPGRVGPDDIAGTHTTVEGSDVTVTRDGDEIEVNDVSVVCGGIQTANATVYLIDQVLTPPAEG
ncbi:fasciclin domain-containing protein [Nocardia higoensis]|uniref:Fasciclin domain-containing protein n=1 Tax=Nocardia higoensis TaxID=228599 RepID=A0ABS0D9B0_9NOCA|nr:fasciclin domain-containing protein [Nocardia higoensis]MBF6354986.1 fasciclin domain-containing protein [Nocardia higoensis]